MAEEQFNIYNLQEEDWEKEANPQADVGELGSQIATLSLKKKIQNIQSLKTKKPNTLSQWKTLKNILVTLRVEDMTKVEFLTSLNGILKMLWLQHCFQTL